MDISNNSPAVFAFIRTLESATALVLLNFTKDEVEFPINMPPGKILEGLKLVLGNYGTDYTILNPEVPARLRGYEGRIYWAA